MYKCKFCNRERVSLDECSCKERTLWRIGNLPIDSINKKRRSRLKRSNSTKIKRHSRKRELNNRSFKNGK